MIKKSILLLVVLLIAGLAFVSAQDMAKMQKIQKEMEQIGQAIKARGGVGTAQETARLQQLQQEMIAAMGPYGGMVQQGYQQGMTPEGKAALEQQKRQIEQQQQSLEQYQQQLRQVKEQADREQAEKAKYPGNNRSWPAAEVFKQYKLPVFTKPSGTSVASYALTQIGVDFHIYIFLTGANSADLQEIKRQVETKIGPMKADSESPNSFIATGKSIDNCTVYLKLYGSNIEFEFYFY